MTIIHLVATQSAALMVYRTSNHLHSYQILFRDGSVYQPQELYPHTYIALNVGRDRIKLVTGHPD